MKTIKYTVKDELGLHARPAGLLVKYISTLQCNVTIEKGGKSADAKRLFGVMGLGVKKNDVITFTLDGADEVAAATGIQDFCTKNF